MKSNLILLLILNCNILSSQIKTSSHPPSQYIHFSPSKFYNSYDAKTLPVLKIRDGDTINTESLDALGFDKNSIKKGERGNPLTGPFFIEQASPGDIVAVTIVNLSLNRNYATTLNAFIPKILPKADAKRLWRNAKLVKWNLDLINNTASPAKEYERLSALKVPLHPFLGSIGVAPPGASSISSGGFGSWGGNLDFSAITALSTLYLPVFHEGALLYVGDGHAVQGDGELNGDALENSMNFTFTVRVIKNEGSQLKYPRVEDLRHIMAFGQAKNLDLALKEATLNLLSWLQKDYQLSIEEASQLIGPVVEYRIPKIASTEVEVVAMIQKKVIEGLVKINGTANIQHSPVKSN
ncbi:acetamidase/formamidase family protein [Longitalea luteola]|uniref:acetamidase/formamidase family protein n=1 Tax=Longitalea luteola TaxID=2812563 RepID=UPI001A97AEB3|nr:acetamidase/formamidase family protein [Longitalea luteola]